MLCDTMPRGVHSPSPPAPVGALQRDSTALRSLLRPRRSNVLVSAGWRASVSDLGLAQVLAGSARTAVGFTRVYAAPEQLLGQRCTLAADMYRWGAG